jgi:murein DD-endopeptidase MepM/ murein hydrolase activator NlpD
MKLFFRNYIYIIFFTLASLAPSISAAQVVTPDDTIPAGFNEEEEEEEDTLESSVDSLFMDVLRPQGFSFDSVNAPHNDKYNRWDTVVIDPYREDLIANPDTINLILADSSDCFFYPPCVNYVTSGFGYRRWGRRLVKFHYGIDFSLKTGDPVYAAFDGVVRIAKWSSSYGFMVVIRHYNGLETLYGHFSKLLVYPGQAVRSGDRIGLGGSTGWSTGSHLHLEIRYKGKPIDPTRIISFDRKQLLCDTLKLGADYFSHLKTAKALYQNKSRWGKYNKKRNKAQYHKVRRNESIYMIAYRYHTTVARICKLNRISKRSKLKAGRVLRVR